MTDLELKKLRKDLGLTQAELAKVVGVDIKTIQNWEGGRKIPRTKHGILRNLELETRTKVNKSGPTKIITPVPASSALPTNILEELLTEARSERARLLAIVETQQQTIHDLTREIKKDNAQPGGNAVCADAG